MEQMNRKQKRMLARILVASAMTIALQFADTGGWMRLALYLTVYFIAGYDILKKAASGIINGRVFDENFLMATATIGAFALALYERSGDYLEAIAVMLFYQIGEFFQSYAVGRSRRNIAALMDIRPDYANIERDGNTVRVAPDEVETGAIIIVGPGEKIPIDGLVTEGRSSLNTSALTGESLPRDVGPGDEVISGCINMSSMLKIRTTKEFGESAVSKILELVEDSAAHKSKSENFIARFARTYTPVVCYAALALAVLPPLFMAGFKDLIPIPLQTLPEFIICDIDQHIEPYYIDVAESYGLPADVCSRCAAETGVTIDDAFPIFGKGFLSTNMPCNASEATSMFQRRRVNLPYQPVTMAMIHNEPGAHPYSTQELKNAIAFIEKEYGVKYDWNALFERAKHMNEQNTIELEKWDYFKTPYSALVGIAETLYRLYSWASVNGQEDYFTKTDRKVIALMRKAYEEIKTALLPGYVFVYLPEEPRPVNWWTFSGVIRPLGYGEGRRDYLAGSDLAFAQWVWQKEGNISHVKVVAAGDRIEIADGLFSRMRGTIIRVDRRKKTCCVALDTSGIIRQVWLPYELVEPVDAPRAVGPQSE